MHYAWEFDNGGGWTPFGTDASTQSVTQAVATSYHCTVSCAEIGGGSQASNDLAVPMVPAAGLPQDFETTQFPPCGWSELDPPNAVGRGSASAFGIGTGDAMWDFFTASGTNDDLQLNSPTFTPLATPQTMVFDVAGGWFSATVDFMYPRYSIDGGTNWIRLDTLYNNGAAPFPNTTSIKTEVAASGEYNTPLPGEWITLSYNVPAGTNRVGFQGDSNFGDNVHIDNVRIVDCDSAHRFGQRHCGLRHRYLYGEHQPYGPWRCNDRGISSARRTAAPFRAATM